MRVLLRFRVEILPVCQEADLPLEGRIHLLLAWAPGALERKRLLNHSRGFLLVRNLHFRLPANLQYSLQGGQG